MNQKSSMDNRADEFGQKIIPCKYCGIDTTSSGTKMCDGCWELSHIRMVNIEVVAKIIKGELSDVRFQELIELLSTGEGK